MRRAVHLLFAIAAASLALAGLTACGASSSGDSTVVARVGELSITRGTLSHWMATIIGGDYDENVRQPAPRGLVSDPPNYPRCVSAIETLGQPKHTSETPTQVHAAVERDCHQIYQDLKQQALAYLIHGLWTSEEAAEDGIVVTDAQVQQELRKLKAERYPSEAAFTAYLAGREWALSDELYLLKRDLLYSKLGARHEQDLRRTVGDSSEALQRAVLEHEIQSVKRWKTKTSCRPGYVIPECSQYSGPETTGAPDALLEQIAAERR